MNDCGCVRNKTPEDYAREAIWALQDLEGTVYAVMPPNVESVLKDLHTKLLELMDDPNGPKEK